MKNIKEFKNCRHMLNTDSCGGGGQMQMGGREYEIGKYNGISKL